MQPRSSTLQFLSDQFSGKVLIPFAAASEAIGIAEQTARNRLSRKTYPIPTVVIGRRRFVHISALAEYVDSLSTPTPKRGRRTKAEQMARREAAAMGIAEPGRA